MMDLYSRLLALAEQENYEEAGEIIEKLNSGFIESAYASVDILWEQYEAAERYYNELRALAAKDSKAVSEQELKEAEANLERTKAEYELAGGNAAKSAKSGWENEDFGSAADSSMADIAESIKDNETLVYDATSEAASEGEKGFKDSDPESIGVWFAQGFASGIYGSMSDVVRAAKEMASAANNEVKNEFGIASPSKVMKKYGG
ncbi:MAG: hypothetical protein K2H01_02365, partial [Ruminococcus sp.]|nr:hypothetical protein [Ruminococcus sp.]